MEKRKIMIKLSIILPIYNVADYLPACLNSLFVQDVDESCYEVICVNDGSSDNCESIVKSYQKFHSNIVLIVKENEGVSKARNTGLRAAKGSYIWFIDPDDFIEKNCLKFILSSLEETNADICNVDFKGVPENYTSSNEKDNKDFTMKYLSKQIGSCCGHIVRRNMVPEIKQDLRYGEDYLWEFETCALAKKQITVSPKVYYYRQRSNSAMHIKSKETIQKQIDDMMKLALYYKEFLNDEQYVNLKRNVEDRIGLCVGSILTSLIKNDFSKSDIKSTVNTLKKDKLYPYKPLWFLLKPRIQIKVYFLNLFSFFLFSEHIFRLLIRFKRG